MASGSKVQTLKMAIYSHNQINAVALLSSERLTDIKALTILVSRLSLSVGRENGPEWALKTASFNP